MHTPMTTHLNIMLDGLKKKSAALSEILGISENQSTVIESELPLDEVREMILSMNSEKQAAIQTVKDCDDMFEKMLKEIGPELEAEQEMYKPQVKVLQENIRNVMSLDVKIRLTEEENNRKLDERRAKENPLPASLPGQAGPAGPAGLKPKVNIPTDSAKVLRAYKQGAKNFKG